MTNKKLLQSGIFCILILLFASLVLGMWSTSKILGIEAAGETTQSFKVVFLFGCACACFLTLYWQKTGTLSEDKLIFMVFLLVFLGRLCYILANPINSYQHDVSTFTKLENNNGHSGVIEYYRTQKQLPDFSPVGKGQFYHPPLHHILCALWLTVQTKLNIPWETALENLQVLTLFYSMLAMYASYRILQLLNIKGTPLILALCVIGFHPTFFLLSGSINNDCLSIALQTVAVWFALEWYKDASYKNILLLGLSLGLAMLAKLSVGIVAPAIAFLFLYRWVKEPDWAARGRMLPQFVAFGLICIPLGIGWQVRNYLLYDMPLTYVPMLSEKNSQYLGIYSTSQRFFDFDSLKDYGVFPSRAIENGGPYYEHNVLLAPFKMSCFGEYFAWKGRSLFDPAAVVLFWTNAAIVLTSLVGLGYTAVQFVRRTASEFAEKIGFTKPVFVFLAAFHVCTVGSYILFCFQYPHFCSMDFRYIVSTILLGTVWVSVLFRAIDRRASRPLADLDGEEEEDAECDLLSSEDASACAEEDEEDEELDGEEERRIAAVLRENAVTKLAVLARSALIAAVALFVVTACIVYPLFFV